GPVRSTSEGDVESAVHSGLPLRSDSARSAYRGSNKPARILWHATLSFSLICGTRDTVTRNSWALSRTWSCSEARVRAATRILCLICAAVCSRYLPALSTIKTKAGMIAVRMRRMSLDLKLRRALVIDETVRNAAHVLMFDGPTGQQGVCHKRKCELWSNR